MRPVLLSRSFPYREQCVHFELGQPQFAIGFDVFPNYGKVVVSVTEH